MNADDPVRRSDDAVLRSIWFGFLAAPVVYVLIAWLAVRDLAPTAYPRSMDILFVAVAVGAVALGRVLPARMLAAGGASGATTAGGRRDRRRTALIVRWACDEVPAVLGLALAFLGARLLPAVAGAAIALILIRASRPVAARPPGGR